MNLEHLFELLVRHCLHMSEVTGNVAYLDKAAEIALKVQRMHEAAAKEQEANDAGQRG